LNSLLLVTHDYPLDRGDSSFIKNEIPFLSKYFDKIYVFCTSNYDNSKKIIKIPNNVIVYFNNFKNTKLRKYIIYLVVLFNHAFYYELKYLIKKRRLTIKTLRSSLAFMKNAIILNKQINNILRKINNIKIIYTFWYIFETLASLLLKKKYKISYITRAHGYDVHEFQNDLNYQPYKYWMDKNIDRIFFASQYLCDYYLRTFANSDTKKYITMPLGIINDYPVEINNKNRNTDIFVLCSCSFIIPRKRVNLIIKALNQINNFKIHWIHIGDGSDMNSILSLSYNLQKKNNISFEFKGFMTSEQIMNFYNDNYIDCFISTTESEGGCPVSMQEAISFGIPVIATSVGGVPEVVTKDTGFLLSPEGNISEISNAIIDFYNFPEDKKNALRRSARKFWESNFNAEMNYTKFSEELLSIVVKKPKKENI